MAALCQPPFLPPSELGEAADAGSVAIEIKDGLTLVWQGLASGTYTASSATIAADSRDLSLVGRRAHNPASRSTNSLCGEVHRSTWI